MIREYVDKGGNLLLLLDPGSLHGLAPLTEQLGIHVQPGVIVDPTTQLFGINDPRFAIVAEYPAHPVTRGFDRLTLLPQASGLEFNKPEGWDGEAILETVARSWSETGPMQGELAMDKGKDIPGPLTVGVALTRDFSEKNQEKRESPADPGKAAVKAEQRVIVVGDGDFLSNKFLANGGNLDLGMNMLNWLTHDDALISIPSKITPDRNLELSKTIQLGIFVSFLLLVPAVLAGSGVMIWWKRRKQ
jgi:ABC-type uncharacterized transport system involved in gliding motility auxiliary subunit